MFRNIILINFEDKILKICKKVKGDNKKVNDKVSKKKIKRKKIL